MLPTNIIPEAIPPIIFQSGELIRVITAIEKKKAPGHDLIYNI